MDGGQVKIKVFSWFKCQREKVWCAENEEDIQKLCYVILVYILLYQILWKYVLPWATTSTTTRATTRENFMAADEKDQPGESSRIIQMTIKRWQSVTSTEVPDYFSNSQCFPQIYEQHISVYSHTEDQKQQRTYLNSWGSWTKRCLLSESQRLL